MLTTFIYGLSDPTQYNKIRYIGKSDKPEIRYFEHLKDATTNINTHKTCWIRKLLSQNLQPTLIILDEVPIDKWKWFEKTWIDEYRKLGFKLVNTAEGGWGGAPYGNSYSIGNKNMLGKHHSEESRLKMKKAKMGNKNRVGTKHSANAIDKLKLGWIKRKENGYGHPTKGITKTEEQRKKISDTLKRRYSNKEIVVWNKNTK